MPQRCFRTGVPGQFEFPGGCNEWGESIVETLKREVMEGVGFNVTKIHGIENHAENNGIETFTPHSVYFGRHGWTFTSGEFEGQRAKSVCVHFKCEAVGIPLDKGDKSTEIQWVTPERLRALLDEPDMFGNIGRGAAELFCKECGV